jgi:hypothetical protein
MDEFKVIKDERAAAAAEAVHESQVGDDNDHNTSRSTYHRN